jgi:tripartite-type tricarboxylate transporter receptor subunit TctC
MKKGNKRMGKEEEEIIATLEKIAKKVDEDPKVRELAEEYQRKYGTLTGEDLRKSFTI